MWIVFGWEKEERPLGEVATAYCYDCRRLTNWIVWNESEWVTFSDIRTLRFVNKHRLHCDGCTEVFELKSAEFRKINRYMKQHDSIDGTPIHDVIAKRIESEQLAGKTPLQIEYIQKSLAAEREYDETMKEQEAKDT